MFGLRKSKTPDILSEECYPAVVTFYSRVHQELAHHGLKHEWATIDKGLYWGVAVATEAAAQLMLVHSEFKLINFQRWRDCLINMAVRDVYGMIYAQPKEKRIPKKVAEHFNSFFPVGLRSYEHVRDAHFDFSEIYAPIKGVNAHAYYELVAENGLHHICEYPGGDTSQTPEGKRRYQAVIEVSKPAVAQAALHLQSKVTILLAENLKALSASHKFLI